MSKSKTKAKSKVNYAVPGKPLSEEEFNKMIEDAEKGPFYTTEESKKMFEDLKTK
jgi:hypothetical protein